MSKKCKAGHENPDSANFCRICGQQLIDRDTELKERLKAHIRNLTIIIKNYLSHLSGYSKNFTMDNVPTPDIFCTIELKPISVVKIRFFNRFLVVVSILCLLFASAVYFSGVTDWTLHIWLSNQDIYIPLYLITGVIVGVNLLLIALVIWAILTVKKKLVFSFNVDYIEDYPFVENNKRIAKNKKLGLYDEKKKKVRLWSRYDKIEKFDDEHLVISRNGRIGIYRLKAHKIIVPIRYTRIEPFNNSMTKATDGKIIDHYDIKGNRLK